ncbi:hypothetical protein [Paenibacillus amylolyticus]|uniref:hypothetical protein n=1 Tax=Paenibacillus amylolyticus TaxID=1451 RepID=UPI003EBE997C
MINSISYYIAPLLDDNLSFPQFESSIVDFCDLLDAIIDNEDEVKIPKGLYETAIVNDIIFADYLFNTEYASDTRELFFEVIMKQIVDDIDYNSLFSTLDSSENTSYKALTGIVDNKFINQDQLYVKNKNFICWPHRFYLLRSRNLDDFKRNYRKCFPMLIFHERIEKTLNVFNDITEHVEEVVRHLSVLNDFAKELYLETGGASDEIYRRLKSEYNIISSGRGSNESLNKFLCNFSNMDNEFEEVRCNPHSKLYTDYSEYRIYFNWGRERIENGKILIGHIGGHWA